MPQKLLIFLLLSFAFSAVSIAQQPTLIGGGAGPIMNDVCLSDTDYDFIQSKIQDNINALAADGKLSYNASAEKVVTQFAWPLQQAAGFDQFDYYATINYVDLDGSPAIEDYNCGARAYDGHNGLDISLWPFWWKMMDENQVEVIAGAPGQIIFKQDGNYDQNCNCQGMWNAVYVQHADGSIAWYGHLKTGTLTDKLVGDQIEEGDYVGIVGSSGCSSNPHLHFELRDENQNVIELSEGNCNSTISESWWQDQKAYREPGLNFLMTHDEAPSIAGFCPNEEITNFKTEFDPGDAILFSAYYHDQIAQAQTTYRIKDPSGNIYTQWDHGPASDFSTAYWYWTYTLPVTAEQGIWTFEAQFLGENFVHEFQIGINVNINELPDIGLEMFPNPTSGTVQLDYKYSENLIVQLINQRGEKVVVENEGENILSIGHLSNGVYLLQLIDPQGQIVAREKLVKLD